MKIFIWFSVFFCGGLINVGIESLISNAITHSAGTQRSAFGFAILSGVIVFIHIATEVAVARALCKKWEEHKTYQRLFNNKNHKNIKTDSVSKELSETKELDNSVKADFSVSNSKKETPVEELFSGEIVQQSKTALYCRKCGAKRVEMGKYCNKCGTQFLD